MKEAPIRDTFGVKDSDGNLYPDIISYHLETLLVAKPFLVWTKIYDSKGREYKLHRDSRLRQELGKLHGKERLKVIVSFQQRTTGNFAFARLYEENRKRKLNKETK